MSISYIIALSLSVISVGLWTISCVQKTKKRLIFYQAISTACDIAYAFLMNAFSAAICNIAILIRDILVHRDKNNKLVMYIIAAICLATGLIFNTTGWLGVLALTATLEYTIALIYLKDLRKIKIAVLISTAIWCLHDWLSQFWLYAICDTINVIVLVIEIAKPASSNQEAK